ncbi:hypothetical protein GCM10027590_50720 [Nocardiopsis nanhaiensis]
MAEPCGAYVREGAEGSAVLEYHVDLFRAHAEVGENGQGHIKSDRLQRRRGTHGDKTAGPFQLLRHGTGRKEQRSLPGLARSNHFPPQRLVVMALAMSLRLVLPAPELYYDVQVRSAFRQIGKGLKDGLPVLLRMGDLGLGSKYHPVGRCSPRHRPRQKRQGRQSDVTGGSQLLA